MADVPNAEAAEILVREARLLPIAASSPLYEKLVTVFPTAAKIWTQYLDALLASNNDEAAKQAFSRCLLNCLHIPLWIRYIKFIRKTNNPKGQDGIQETQEAFKLMLNCVGEDMSSGTLWMEYIAFLKSIHPVSMPTTTVQVRSAYQKAILTPNHHIESLWMEYQRFENSVSRASAKAVLAEYQPKFNCTRAVYWKRKKYIDQIDWSMLAFPPNEDDKHQQRQYMAWKKLLLFDKGNPQRIEAKAANNRLTLTYEQSLMYLYYFADVWYDYATWLASTGSVESAVKVFHRSLKALPDCDSLKYAFAELEESRGSIQAAKKIYENLLANNGNATSSVAHIQFIRFLRRTEGVDAARKYFLDTRKSPSCTYHVFVAYAKLAYCLDKDPKFAQKVFEAGLHKFLHEPQYILEYADFLCCLNDATNACALFERALSTLPPEDSVEVWKRFVQFEHTYGDLASILKVEQRMKDALSKIGEEGTSILETSLYDVVSRYSYMDLWPCSAKDLNYLARQQWLANNINKTSDKYISIKEKMDSMKTPGSAQIIYPDTSRMLIYDPRQTLGPQLPAVTSPGNPIASVGCENKEVVDEISKVLSPALLSFITHLPAVEGPTPDIDKVLAVLLQSTIPTEQTGKSAFPQPVSAGQLQSISNLSGYSRTGLNQDGTPKGVEERHSTKRKNIERQEDDEATNLKRRPVPQDIFRLRQIQKSRGASNSQTGSAGSGAGSGGSASVSTVTSE